ncbi:epoxide hydrolase N-terminal domain-containing protein [Amycolatopsis vancoresmycina]
MNGFPQFTTEIDGQDIHFLHVRSPRTRSSGCTRTGSLRSPRRTPERS